MNPSTALATVIVNTLVDLGVGSVVLCPGSRSAPLAYALADAAAQRRIELHVRVDERSAGFLALGLSLGGLSLGGLSLGGLSQGGLSQGGLSQGGPAPAAVVTTSGTAVANLHPAVLEAAHAGVPLLVISADRPHELRGTGASQTTDQVKLFGDAVRWFAEIPAPVSDVGQVRFWRNVVTRAVALARGNPGAHPGPVHLNVAFADPLTPSPGAGSMQSPAVQPASAESPAIRSPMTEWPVTRRPAAQSPVAEPLVDPLAAGPLSAGPLPAGPLPAGPLPAGPLPAGPLPAGPPSAGSMVTEWPEPLTGSAGRPVIGPLPQPVSMPLALGPRTVVLAADGSRDDAAQAIAVAAAGDWPLLAEATSGARTQDAIGPYRLLLEQPGLGARIERVLVFGRPTLSRPVTRLLARADVEVIVVSRRPDWTDATRRASLVTPAVTVDVEAVGGVRDPAWKAAWQVGARAATAAIDQILDDDARAGRLSGPLIAREVAAATGPGDVLFVGSSNPVRDLDLAAGPFPPGALVLANRGLAGIDGTLSSAAGVALALTATRWPAGASPGRFRCLVGDLTFLHDAGALLTGALERCPDLQVIVVDDDGGGIFALLEHGGLADRGALEKARYERVFGTPQRADLAALCLAYGAAHRLVTDVDDLRKALAEPVTGFSVIQVRVDRAGHRQLASRLAAAAQAAADEAVADQAAVNQAAVDQAAVNQAAVNQAAVDEAAVDQAAVDQAAVNQAAVDEAAVDQAAADQDRADVEGVELRAHAAAPPVSDRHDQLPDRRLHPLKRLSAPWPLLKG